jgi:hypothetical protein
VVNVLVLPTHRVDVVPINSDIINNVLVRSSSTGMDVFEELHFSEALPVIELDDNQSLVYTHDEFVGVGSKPSDRGSSNILAAGELVFPDQTEVVCHHQTGNNSIGCVFLGRVEL